MGMGMGRVREREKVERWLLDTIRFGLDECKTKVDRLTIGRPPSDAYGASTLVFQVSCCIL